MAPGGKYAVVLDEISKLSQSSPWVAQSIQPTLTRPSCIEKHEKNEKLKFGRDTSHIYLNGRHTLPFSLCFIYKTIPSQGGVRNNGQSKVKSRQDGGLWYVFCSLPLKSVGWRAFLWAKFYQCIKYFLKTKQKTNAYQHASQFKACSRSQTI